MEAVSRRANWESELDPLALAKGTIRQEANELLRLADRLNSSIVNAVRILESCSGSVVVTGIGKAGLVGQKVSATLCSTGTRSSFLHAAEGIHGDLGRVAIEDCILAFSMSGETEELLRVLPSLRSMAANVVSVTGNATNTLGRHSDAVIALGDLAEADPNGLAPSTSTTAMMAVGDALALAVSQRRGFRESDFVRFHPGGSLGRKLTPVRTIMRPLSECRAVLASQTVRESCMTLRGTARRTGAVMIVDEAGKLAGIFTDSDLARLLEKQANTVELESAPISPLEMPVSRVMTVDPFTVQVDALMPAAIELLAQNQISELPVVDSGGRPMGLIDITDVINWLPGASGGMGDTSPDRVETSDQPRLVPFSPPDAS